MTDKDKEQLRLDIKHIFESGVNEIRIYKMVENFINTKFKNKIKDFSCDCEKLYGWNIHVENCKSQEL